MAGAEDPQLPSWLTKMLGGGGKSSAGVVAALSTVAIAAFVLFAAAVYGMPHNEWRLTAIVIGAGVLIWFVERMLNLVKRDPLSAGMSGKELLDALKNAGQIKGSGNPAPLPPPEANVAPPQIAPPARDKPEEKPNA